MKRKQTGRNQQSGQALIVTMVMTIFIFSLAGGLAVATSALLMHENASRTTLNDQFLAQNAIDAATAWGAGRGIATNPAYCQTPTLLPPLGQPSEIPGVQCLEIDNISPLTPGLVPLSWNGGTCSVTALPASGRTLVWLNGSSGLSAYVDQNPAAGCTSGAGMICAATGATAPTQLRLDCNLPAAGSPILHVSTSGRTPLSARYAAYAAAFQTAPGSPRATLPQPAGLIAADLARSNRLDLVMVDSGSNKVSVLPHGPGDGSFGNRADYTVENNPTGVWVGDLNGDGYPDIAVANSGSGTISVLMNKGDGTFSNRVDYVVHGTPVLVVGGHFTNAGGLDLAVLESNPNQVEVLISQGGGTYDSSDDVAPSGLPGAPTAVAVGDFNGNGRSDLAVAEGGNVRILMSEDGDGTLEPAPGGGSYGVGSGATSIVAADVGNGKTDLVVADPGTGNVTVLLGVGNGRFGNAPGSPFSAGVGVSATAVADFNSDGIPDLAVVNQISNTVSLFIGRGDGSFWPDAGGTVPVGGSGASAVVSGDFNGDGYPDLAIANSGSSSVSVLLANRSRSALYAFAAQVPGGYEEADLVVSGDGSVNKLTFEGKL